MADKLPRAGQAVHAADGEYLGRLLQRDQHFMVIAKSWWRLDFYVIPNAEIAAADRDRLTLRCLACELQPETADPWSPAPDPHGNANGVDLEPLRAGMAEIDGSPPVPIAAPRTGAPMVLSRPEPPLPSPEDIDSLDRERVARIDAQIDRYIAAELEDLQIAASCETPPGFEHAASYEVAFALEGTSPALRRAAHRPRIVFSLPGRDRTAFQHAVAPAAPMLSAAGDEAARTATALERTLCRAGFSRVEAEAIATAGYDGLAALHSASSPGDRCTAARRDGGGVTDDA